jgi:hypothetical protein
MASVGAATQLIVKQLKYNLKPVTTLFNQDIFYFEEISSS